MNSISFKGFKVISLSFQTEQQGLEDNVSVNYQTLFSQESDREFVVIFKIALYAKDGTEIHLDYAGFFEAEEAITQDFMDSNFPVVNAPAILYPYIRSFISTLTMNAGMPAVILPTVNFQALTDQKRLAEQTELPLNTAAKSP